jgi:mono/diheme cytochrome c family protein
MRRATAVLLALCALLLAGCGGGEEAAPTAETVQGTLPADTSGEAETGAETGGDGEGEGDPEAGAEIYASAGCGGCHALDDAGSSGNIGPDLDDSKPDHALVVDRVTNGEGAMPPFAGQLTDEEIDNVAAYVSSVAGG